MALTGNITVKLELLNNGSIPALRGETITGTPFSDGFAWKKLHSRFRGFQYRYRPSRNDRIYYDAEIDK